MRELKASGAEVGRCICIWISRGGGEKKVKKEEKRKEEGLFWAICWPGEKGRVHVSTSSSGPLLLARGRACWYIHRCVWCVCGWCRRTGVVESTKYAVLLLARSVSTRLSESETARPARGVSRWMLQKRQCGGEESSRDRKEVAVSGNGADGAPACGPISQVPTHGL